MKIGIIGGGAAGFFAAIHAKKNFPKSEVTILEKSQKLLSKVKVSGGGRCNVTNGCTAISELSKAYPRGEKKLKKAFREFNTKHTMEWFEERGVALTIQEDNCVFPVSQDSQTIIDCFMNEVTQLGINIEMGKGVNSIEKNRGLFEVKFKGNELIYEFDKLIIATGGSPKRTGLEWLEKLGHKIEDPVPSLFTFNMPSEDITKLMGIVVKETKTSIQGTKLKSDGPLLITHWGMSGPSVLKLSAFGARILANNNYEFKLQVNWVNTQNYDEVFNSLKELGVKQPNKLLQNYRAYSLPERLWLYLLEKNEIPISKKWGDLGKKDINKLTNSLTNDIYAVKGKTTFKEEFVTCGGISLESIDFTTMQSRAVPNLYFSGEVMDIDGITGGYNFQSAWTTAFIAGQLK
ncbi:MAG: putative Rossmann fold flavoprotein [Flavobacteriales bacterium]|jgi:predicted Rossmann fold flavoprotein|tara:strand:+ start:662 stop:1873 length:1212 start_codon:yes stop_codon:yes gene_type:complete